MKIIVETLEAQCFLAAGAFYKSGCIEFGILACQSYRKANFIYIGELKSLGQKPYQFNNDQIRQQGKFQVYYFGGFDVNTTFKRFKHLEREFLSENFSFP